MIPNKTPLHKNALIITSHALAPPSGGSKFSSSPLLLEVAVKLPVVSSWTPPPSILCPLFNCPLNGVITGGPLPLPILPLFNGSGNSIGKWPPLIIISGLKFVPDFVIGLISIVSLIIN